MTPPPVSPVTNVLSCLRGVTVSEEHCKSKSITKRSERFLLLVQRRQVEDEGSHEQQEHPFQRQQDGGADQPRRGRQGAVHRRGHD